MTADLLRRNFAIIDTPFEADRGGMGSREVYMVGVFLGHSPN